MDFARQKPVMQTSGQNIAVVDSKKRKRQTTVAACERCRRLKARVYTSPEKTLYRSCSDLMSIQV